MMLVPALVIAAYCIFFILTFVRSGPKNPFVHAYIALIVAMFMLDMVGWWAVELAAFILILFVLASTRRMSLFSFYVFNFFLGVPYGHIIGVPLHYFFTKPGTYAMLDYKVEEFVDLTAAYCLLFMVLWGTVFCIKKVLRHLFPVSSK